MFSTFFNTARFQLLTKNSIYDINGYSLCLGVRLAVDTANYLSSSVHCRLAINVYAFLHFKCNLPHFVVFEGEDAIYPGPVPVILDAIVQDLGF